MVLLLGSVAVVLAATALPHGWPPALASDGDLVLRPGGGGLQDLPVLWDDPRSLAALLLVLNVVLYVPVGAFARLALPDHGARALLIPLVLSVAVEAWQFVGLGRVGSLDDVLLNLAGATVGWFAARLVTDARGRSHLVGQDGRPTT
ncbi:VanZ family protein [Nitriliruptoria bacterium AS10]|nr:VanZ family protein [Salsipaludibacter albus]